MPIKIGDIERMLPYGMYLHKKYDHQKHRAVCRLTETNIYIQRKNTILEQNEQIKEQRIKLKLQMLKKKEREKVIIEKFVPITSRSSKHIQDAKKVAKMIDPFTGELITMEEMMNRSKEGGAGKGGRGVK